MKKQKKLGFTLIELLAVIVILALIIAIAAPSISGIINNTTKNAFKVDASMILKQLEYQKLKDDNFDVTTTTVGTLSNYNISNENYDNLMVGTINNKVYILINGKNKWSGLKACGTIHEMSIVSIDDTETCEDLSTFIANPPILATGMTPIKWDGSAWVTTTSLDTDWYSYTTTDKKWANVQTADGSMWVWIPRYIYNISSGWHTSTIGTIDVQFIKGTDDTIGETITIANTGSANDSNGTWANHPAFTFGTAELTGIWVAKFEASGTTSAIDIKPNVPSLRNVTVDNMFTAARNMETNSTYGWGTSGINLDTHLMKNVEWGAIAYLSQSTYGKNSEIFRNPSVNYITGRGSISATKNDISDISDSASTDLYSYDGKTCSSKIGYVCTGIAQSVYGMSASTTGNIYGIYDMSGGSYEYVSAYVNNSYANDYGESIVNADAKYKDVYTVGTTDTSANNYIASINHKGDAVYETSGSAGYKNSWYSNSANMPNASTLWFVRGGSFQHCCHASYMSSAGIYSYGNILQNSYGGNATIDVGFRPVIIVGAGL